MTKQEVRINELDREEFWDVARKANPKLSREEFDRQYDEFEAEKRRRMRQ